MRARYLESLERKRRSLNNNYYYNYKDTKTKTKIDKTTIERERRKSQPSKKNKTWRGQEEKHLITRRPITERTIISLNIYKEIYNTVAQ